MHVMLLQHGNMHVMLLQHGAMHVMMLLQHGTMQHDPLITKAITSLLLISPFLINEIYDLEVLDFGKIRLTEATHF